MSLVHTFVLAAQLLDPSIDDLRPDPASTPAGRLVTTSRGVVCFDGPHHPMRVRKLPSAPATSARTRNPLEDSYVHCSDASAEDGHIRRR